MEIGLLSPARSGNVAHVWQRFGIYLNEILDHAGMPYRPVAPERLPEELERLAVLVLPTHLALTEEEAAAVDRFVREGNVLVGFGGTSGLSAVFGCRQGAAVAEAWVHFDAAHPVAGGTTGPLHAFGGFVLEPAAGDVRVLAEWKPAEAWSAAAGWSGAGLGAAAALRRHGRGWALVIGADAAYSVLRIQQGYPVHADAVGPADGTATVDEGILKTDDGIALDYERDRRVLGGVPVFDRPIGDEWREVVVRSLLWAAGVRGITLPLLGYWPSGLPAVGQISHDTDGNVPRLGTALFEQLQRLGVPTTWCVQYPGGYAPEFYRALVRAGSEIALHYDAHSNRVRSFWGEAHFNAQLDWLREIAGVPILSNKNHYLRWEGLTEFFVWLERAGVPSDQTKGGTKTGNRGFTFGGTHPWFPVDEQTRRTIDVLEVNLHTWELVNRDPLELGEVVVDQAIARGGVAHFLYHPALIHRPEVVESLDHIVRYGNARGIPWWTNARIQAWERARRTVTFELDVGDGKPAWRVRAGEPLREATLYLVDPRRPGTDTVHGFAAHRRIVDLAPGEPVTL